jgi:YVTN family beta-propeller protein
VGGFSMPGGLPPPTTNCAMQSQPQTGLIVKFNPTTVAWEDELHRNWNNAVRFSLPDEDVFTIDASHRKPVPAGIPYTGVGTVIFNMAVNPVSGKVYVSNTDAHNDVRFEGPGSCSSTVRGHLHEARVTVLQSGAAVPRHLNKHIDYAVVPSPAGVKDKSLATPAGMAVSSDGATLYVAAFGSSKVGVFSTAQLENDTFVPSSADHITLTGGGPSGLVLDEARNRLYVFTRFDNSVSVVNTTTLTETAHLPVFNPEPANVVGGRQLLYDAFNTSSNGEASCSACHVFGDFDSLAWDLGNPDNGPLANPNPMEFGSPQPFAPLKGPMTTQSLRGLANHGPMHWRGDRTGGTGGGDPLDEDAAFKKFIVAFDGLLGRNGPITDPQMQAFTDFILQVTYPPNPIRALDNSLNDAQQAGHDLYFGRLTDTVRNCNGCHTLDPGMGFFGTQGKMSFEGETQLFKIPHLRNAYQKVGMFGMPDVAAFKGGNNGDQGPQVRGFGFLHDGSVDTLSRFHSANVFDLDTTEVDEMTRFVLAFDTNLAPIVGQQVTLTRKNSRKVGPRIDLMIARAVLNECEVVVKGTLLGPPAEARGWYRQAGGMFRSDRASEPLLDDITLRAQAATDGQERTYTCVPFGSGQRIGIDRDGDGFFDRTELDGGFDPANPASHP